MRIYSINDLKKREYGPLMLEKNDETVIRMCREGIPPESMYRAYPADFVLMYLGTFDIDHGVLKASEVPIVVESLETILVSKEA